MSAVIPKNALDSALLFSPYFAQHHNNDDALKAWCLNANKSSIRTLIDDLPQLFAPLKNITDELQFKCKLRILRHRVSCAIIYADINYLSDTPEILHATSALANIVLNTALEFGYAQLRQRFGDPIGADGQPQQLIVFGLGKLGGDELNFSSDVDLVFAYESDGDTNGNERQINNNVFYTRLAQKLINLAGELTEHGQPYRIDMRLRPNGDSGPLVLSFAAMEHYFSTHGREWERYAWIKASPVAGDINAGHDFLRTLRPFIYRKYLDYKAFDELAEMKARIEAEAETKGVVESIKLGMGGIRSVEFTTQSFQLARGGRLPSLQTPHLYQALARIHDAELVDTEQYQTLQDAYTFYRRLENHIQMVEDKQQHTLPKSDEALEKHAHYLGFDNKESLLQCLNEHRNNVHAIFSHIFENAEKNVELNSRVLVVTNHLGEKNARLESLRDIGFNNAERHLANIDTLVNGKLSQSLSSNGLSSLNNAINTMLNSIIETELRNNDSTLERIVHLFQSIGRRPTYFDLIAENESVRQQIILLADTSEQLIDALAEHPILLDELISDAGEFAEFNSEKWQFQLHTNLVAANGDIEAQMEILRHQQGAQIFRIAVAEQHRAISRAVAADYLVEVAEIIVSESIFIAKLEAGLPESCTIIPIAYGKLGSKELSYNSDLDLVYVYDDEGEQVEPRLLLRTIRKFSTILTTRTTGGFLYSIDDRLRPNGKSGQLVISLDGYEKYLKEQAWTWEHQALVRARPISDNQRLCERIEKLRRDVISKKRDINKLKKDIAEMNKRMKQHNDSSNADQLDIKLVNGGLVDIEFIAQYLVLAHAHQYPKLCEPRSTTYILRDCQKLGLLNNSEASVLLSTLENILATSQYKKLAGEASRIDATKWQDSLDAVRTIWLGMIEN